MTIRELKAICDVLVEALGDEADESLVEAEHDKIYLPWEEETGKVASQLIALGCCFDDEVESWIHFC